MLRNHPGSVPWALKGPQGQVVSFDPGDTVQFDLDDVPITNGNKANYLMGILLTFTGSLENVSTANAAAIYWDMMCQALIESLQLQNCWHGTPISQNHYKGWNADICEYIGNGYSHFSRRQGPFLVGAASRSFNRNVFIPLFGGTNQKPHHTAQLALFYKKSELVINTASASALAALSPDAVMTGLSVRASAILLPEREARLGPGVEWVDYQTPYAANNDAIEVRSLGNATTLDGVDTGAGLDFLAWITDVIGQPGSSAASNVTRIGVPFLNIFQTTHMQAMIEPFVESTGNGRSIGSVQSNVAAAPNLSDFSGFPFREGSLPTTAANEYAGLQAIALGIYPSRDLQLSKLIEVEGTETYYLSLSSGSGTHHTLAHQYKSWVAAKIADAKDEILRSGIMKKLYPNASSYDWETKVTNKQNPEEIGAEKQRFFPLRLVAK